MEQRRFVIAQLATAIELLEEDERQRAHYLSRFVTTAAVGLFDAALDYLWNETIASTKSSLIRGGGARVVALG